MILDERTEFADANSLIGNAATKQLGDVIDLGAAPTLKDIGTGKTVYLITQIDTTADLATSPTTHWTSGPIAKATLVAGYRFAVALPMEERYERYLGMTATPDTNNITAGAWSSWLAIDPPSTPTLFLPDAQN
jgi:hypothetical protein